MTAGSPFRVDVGDLMASPGRERRHHAEGALDCAIELARTVPDRSVTADVTLRSISGGVMVDGIVGADTELRCYRCLTEWQQPARVEIRELVSTDAGADTDYHVDHDVVDLEPIVRDEMTLALPTLPLCRPDCRGLCPTCGADLNTGACPGHDDESDSPFAGLRDLLETSE